MKKLFLLDAYALIYRAYYAFIRTPRINSKGENTSAVFGFVNTLEEVLNKEAPDYIGVAFDPKGGTFRHRLYPDYKAQREETPEGIRFAVPYIKEVLKAYNIPVIEVPDYEADDVIGTLAWRFSSDEIDVFMMTPDKDYGQLVRPGVKIYRPGNGDKPTEILDAEAVCAKYGIERTEQVIDLLGLMGDASDNIPGCPKVGEKTAVKLIAQFGSIEELLTRTSELKGALKQNVEENAEQIRFSKMLATIKTDVPCEIALEDLARSPKNAERLRQLFDELEFRNLTARVLGAPESAAPSATRATDIFSSAASASPQSARRTKKAAAQSSGMADLFASVDASAESQVQTQQSDKSAIASDKSATLSDKRVFMSGMSATHSDKSASHFGAGALLPHAVANVTTAETAQMNADESAKFPPVGQFGAENANLSDLQSTPHQYFLVENEEEMARICQNFLSEKMISLDTETTSADSMQAELVGLSFSVREHEAYYIPVPAEREKAMRIVEIFKPVYENDAILKIGQNIKYDINVLSAYGVAVRGPLFDTMIAHYVLHPELRHNMDYLAEVYLHYRTIHIEQLIGPAGKNQKTMRDLAPADIVDYAAEDADVTLRLYGKLQAELEQNQLTPLFADIEMPLVPVLAQMEQNGARIDTDALRQTSEDFTTRMQVTEQEIQALAGQPLNVSSPKQVGDLLFGVLRIVDKPKKTKTGQYVTSEEVLQSLRTKHPIVEKILEYRGYKKLLSTYIDSLPSLINPRTGYIHTSYNQAVTATGRLSSSNPNLQNIPIRDDNGKEVRKAFIPDEGCLFFSADYSQIELRIMAHLSQDAHMIEAFREGHDIHRATAAKIYGIPLDDVTSDQRRKAKTANFGIIYGITTFGLAERMQVSRAEAKELIDGYFDTYPRVKAYMDASIEKARALGYTETIFGRRCYLPDINSNNATVRGYAERNAINAPIQGSAADIIKIAMARIHRRMQAEGLRSKLILQVHDELNFSVLPEEKERLQRLVVEEMEGAAHMSVPLVADCGWGSNWLEAH